MMFEWLMAPIDAGRPHNVDYFVSWHARFMVLAWFFLFPLGAVTARFFKITPGQDWPRVLDNKFWWRVHLTSQYAGGGVVVAALVLLLQDGMRLDPDLHIVLGWLVVLICAMQFISGWARGSKGGPTNPAPDGSWRGDHYDMTPHRMAFEYVHKCGGYAALSLAVGAVYSGMWQANAPHWMWIVTIGWILVLSLLIVVLQRWGMARDTYEAIWGPDPVHPGNGTKVIGWGVIRHGHRNDREL